MPTSGDISSKMIDALRASEPDLDTSIGTPLRKILDAVSESVAEAYADQHLITYAYDIDSKVEGDLDDFVALFGFGRIPAQRAQGVVTFSRPNDNTSAQSVAIISPGTQVVAMTNPLIYAQTTLAAVMNPGQFTVDVPVQAITAGPQGNVAAGLLTSVVEISGTVSSVVNANALNGGTAQESDDQLRTRFKATVFRSLAGTKAMYEAVAREIPRDPSTPDSRAISSVNVLGSSKRWREQIQVVSGSATSGIVGAAYIFADNVFCGANIDAGTMSTPGVNYNFVPSNPTTRADASANVTVLGGMPDGLYDLDFEYVPQASRNDPGNTRFAFGGTNNRIDVWANGQVLASAVQSIVFQNTRLFSATVSNQYYVGRFDRSNSGTVITPVAGQVFIPLAYGPIVSVPSTITISAVTYVLGTDYWIVHQNDCFGYGPNSAFGLAWNASKVPANGTVFSFSYTYNQIGQLLQNAINQWRLVGTDAKAHCGKLIPVQFNFAMVYDRRFDPTAVKTNIDVALGAFLGNLGFAAALQASDILQTVHNVPGVNNVRFLTSTDNATTYAMQRMSPWTPNPIINTYALSGRAVDIQFAQDQYPSYYGSNIVQKAPSTFGVG
jgi:uncharacterized phage protein gp47/JayE